MEKSALLNFARSKLRHYQARFDFPYLLSIVVLTPIGTCKGGKGVSYCCDKGIDSSSCHWNEGSVDFFSYTPTCNGASQCPAGETRIALDPEGGPDANGNTHECKVAGSSGGSIPTPWYNVDLAFCCKGSAMGAVSQILSKTVRYADRILETDQSSGAP